MKIFKLILSISFSTYLVYLAYDGYISQNLSKGQISAIAFIGILIFFTSIKEILFSSKE